MSVEHFRAHPDAVAAAVAELDRAGIVVGTDAVMTPDPGGRTSRDFINVHVQATACAPPSTWFAIFSAFKRHCPANPVNVTRAARRHAVPRIVRNRTLDRLEDAEDAALILRDLLADADPARLDNSPAAGCCGCGTWMADVRCCGEHYCWPCVDKLGIGEDEYTVLPGRGR